MWLSLGWVAADFVHSFTKFCGNCLKRSKWLGWEIIYYRFIDRDVNITAVDIDPAMLSVATKYFGLVQDEHLNVVIEDGIQFLTKAAKNGKNFKAILFDVDSKDSSLGMSCPPVQFLEPVVLEAVKSCIKDNGMALFSNLYSYNSGPNFLCRFIRSQSGLARWETAWKSAEWFEKFIQIRCFVQTSGGCEWNFVLSKPRTGFSQVEIVDGEVRQEYQRVAEQTTELPGNGWSGRVFERIEVVNEWLSWIKLTNFFSKATFLIHSFASTSFDVEAEKPPYSVLMNHDGSFVLKRPMDFASAHIVILLLWSTQNFVYRFRMFSRFQLFRRRLKQFFSSLAAAHFAASRFLELKHLQNSG